MAKLTSLKTEKRLLDRRAADHIRSYILSGAFPASSRLLETQLSEELEVSRGTVRSALAQLAGEGLVRQVAFTRWEVSGTSVADAWEIYTLRGVLEGLGHRLAAANVTKEDASGLRVIGAKLLKAIRESRYEDATDIDFELHVAIIALARHRRLADQHRLILHQVRFHMVQSGFLPKDYDELADEHEVLIESVIEGDADRAEALARSHNEAEVKLLTGMLKQSALSETVARKGA
jgi:DNA-binding GntR family transcriptional regulator